jgi:hypothetical protein
MRIDLIKNDPRYILLVFIIVIQSEFLVVAAELRIR